MRRSGRYKISVSALKSATYPSPASCPIRYLPGGPERHHGCMTKLANEILTTAFPQPNRRFAILIVVLPPALKTLFQLRPTIYLLFMYIHPYFCSASCTNCSIIKQFHNICLRVHLLTIPISIHATSGFHHVSKNFLCRGTIFISPILPLDSYAPARPSHPSYCSSSNVTPRTHWGRGAPTLT